MGKFEEKILFRVFTAPLAKKLKNTAITANHITSLGFLLAVISAWLITKQELVAAIPVIYMTYFFDKLDGDLARENRSTTEKSTWFDSFLDRIGEIIITISLVYILPVSYAYIGMAALVFPLLFCYHNEFFSRSKYKTSKGTAINIIGYDRAKHFLLLIISLIIGMPELAIVVLALGNVYMLALFIKTMYN